MILILFTLTLFACKNDETKVDQSIQKTEENETENNLLPKNRKDLITIKNNQYIEYYPGKKQIKFQGFVDENQLRDGKWIFYGENGAERSISFYKNGKRDGHTIVKYSNGKLHYTGEYEMDKKVGEWIIYDEKGKKTIKNY